MRLRPHSLENLHHAKRRRPRLERALGRKLIDDAVGEGIGKGDAEFHDVGPGAFQGPDQVGRLVGRGITAVM